MKILNFGSLNIDYVYSVDHFVSKGETIPSNSLEIFPGGKGLNQSIALAKAGAKVYHAGSVGKADGKFLIDTLKEYGIDTENIMQSDTGSGNAIIQVDNSGDNSIIVFGGSNQNIPTQFADKVLDNFNKGDVLLLQNEINLSGYLIDKAYDKGMTIFFNPAPYNKNIKDMSVKKVSCLIVNEIEGKELSQCTCENHSDILNSLIEKYPETNILLTLGSKGCMYYDKKDIYTQDIFKTNVVDTTAAGDTFTGYFISCLLMEKSPKEALKIASKASSIAVSRKGASSSIPTFKEVEKNYDIILASKSPRRREILENIGMDFEIKYSDADESFNDFLSVEDNIETIALKKANSIAEKLTVSRDTYIIGVDTVVVVDNNVLGKPTDEDDAFKMLKSLSGKTHKVISGIAVIKMSNDRVIIKTRHNTTNVTMKNFDDQTILNYIKTKEPMDKAGGYGIQGLGSMLVKEINGCFFNVVGLPVSTLSDMMSELGIDIMKGI